MLRLAAASIRFRAPAFLAAVTSMLLGAVIVMTFASLIDVSRGSGISAGDQETLVTMAAVVGGCGLIIVLFSVATTLTLAVRQRGTEIALLKSVGATPAQVRRMIGGEAVILAVGASLLAIPIAVLAGHALMRMLVSAGLVADSTPYRFGVFALGIGIGVTVMASTAAAWLTARRTARMGIVESLLSASREQPRMGPGRVLIGCIFLAAGVSAATVSALFLDEASNGKCTSFSKEVTDEDDYEAAWRERATGAGDAGGGLPGVLSDGAGRAGRGHAVDLSVSAAVEVSQGQGGCDRASAP